MVERNLQLIMVNDATYAQFIKYTQGKGKVVTRLLRKAEVAKAMMILEKNDPYEIDNFCYSIA